MNRDLRRGISIVLIALVLSMTSLASETLTASSGGASPLQESASHSVSTVGAFTSTPWLDEINRYRAAAGLSAVADNTVWDAGIADHLNYMANTPASYYTGAYQSLHTENPSSPYYTAAGAQEAAASDLFEGAVGWTPMQFIDGWLAAPFHAVGMLRPALQQVAFDSNSTTGDAGLDVISGLTGSSTTSGPVLFPGPGMTTNLTSFGGEVPDPLQTCGWTGDSVGLSLIALLPSAPTSGLTAMLAGPDGTESTSAGNLCVVDENTYMSTDPVYGPTGLSILQSDNAVFLIPRTPLASGSYTATINQASASAITWSFNAVSPVAVTTTSLPAATVGATYSASLLATGGSAPLTWSLASGSLPAGLALTRSGQIAGTPSASGTSSFTVQVTDSESPAESATAELWITVAPATPLPPPVVGMAATPSGSGYWLANAYGGVSAHGGAQFYGSMAGTALNAPITHIVSTSDGLGYWLVAADGGTFSFGDAAFYGSMGGRHLNAPVVDIAPTLDGQGYWLVASDGGIFSFGDAAFHGSMGGQHLNKPVVGISVDNATGGYWEVASDGGIFSFGAPFYGSMGAIALNKPVNGMAPTSDGKGYWFVASDGGIFAFGNAAFHGSMGGTPLNAPVVGMATDSVTGGYWLVASDGGIFSFGATFYGAD
jgi:hypothetical protein